MNLRILSTAAFFGIISSAALAGKISVSGNGQVSRKMDFMEVQVKVQGECFPSSHDILNAVNGAAAKIRSVMDSYLSQAHDSQDRIIAKPGHTSREDRHHYDPTTRSNRLVCKKGWHLTNQITLKIANSGVWSDMQSDILAIVDSYAINEGEVEAIKVHLSQPRPMLFPETLKAMEDQARQQALDDASKTFNSIRQQCHLQEPMIVDIAKHSSGRKIAFHSRAHASGELATPAFDPSFDLLKVDSKWSITWNYSSRTWGNCSLPRSSEFSIEP